MGVATYQACPKCYMYTYSLDTVFYRYRCSQCGYSENVEEMTAYSAYTGAGWLGPLVKADPVPTAFTRTKGKKPTKADLAALSVAIDNVNQGEAHEPGS